MDWQGETSIPRFQLHWSEGYNNEMEDVGQVTPMVSIYRHIEISKEHNKISGVTPTEVSQEKTSAHPLTN